MQILSFFMFVVMAGFIILVVGYGLSLLEGRGERTRCRMPHKVYRRKKVRRHGVRCRLES